ncbi:MAG: DUF2993 domain-containing protein [Clostridia bacterium]|nr:DUF2993 domain-containing protein [Clostridia bacterium]
MKIMSKFLIFALIFSLVIIGLVSYYLEKSINKEVEKAILQGYRGTSSVQAQLKINWFKGGLKGNIESFKITIDDWTHNNWKINNFEGHFKNVKINWGQLYSKKRLVIEKIEQGNIKMVIDENNLNDALSHYYRGFTVKLNEKGISINLRINLLGYEFATSVHGQLKPGRGAEIYFVPEKIDIAQSSIPESFRKELLQKVKIPLSLEKTPFTFQVTTVKIMQDKIIITGKV